MDIATYQNKLRSISTILHCPQRRISAYDILMEVIVKVNKRGDITNRDMDGLRTVLEQIGRVNEVLKS
jgi:hypothetical protein